MGGCIRNLCRAEPAASPEQGLAELCVGWQKTPIPVLRKGGGRRCVKGRIGGEYGAARWESENETESHFLDFLAQLKALEFEL